MYPFQFLSFASLSRWVPFTFLSTIFLLFTTLEAEGAARYGLKELIKIALEKNPTVAVFQANLKATQGELLTAKAIPNPEIAFEGGRGRSLEEPLSKGEYSISINQLIERPRKRLYRKKTAELGQQVARYEAEDFSLELVSEVKTTFYDLLLNKKEEEIAQETQGIVEAILSTVKLKVKTGEAPEFELVKAQVELLKATKELRRARNRIVIARARLNSLLGNSLEEGFDIVANFKRPERRYTQDELLNYALERHPLIIRGKKDIEAKGYALEMEKASVFPDITFNASFDRELDKESFIAGVSIPMPLWYRRGGEIVTAMAARDKTEAEFLQTRIELSRAIAQFYQDYQIALDQLEVFEKGLLKQAKEALRIAEFSYRQGESGLLDLLDAQRVYRTTLLEYNQSFFELEVSLASLERTASGLP